MIRLLRSLLLPAVRRLLRSRFPRPDIQHVLTAPHGDEERRYFLWHIDMLPRLATPAGFELRSGMSSNPVLPERAARELWDAAAQRGGER